jgi:cytochrome c553
MIAITILISFLIIAFSMAWLFIGLAGRQTGASQYQNLENCEGCGKSCGLCHGRKSGL